MPSPNQSRSLIPLDLVNDFEKCPIPCSSSLSCDIGQYQVDPLFQHPSIPLSNEEISPSFNPSRSYHHLNHDDNKTELEEKDDNILDPELSTISMSNEICIFDTISKMLDISNYIQENEMDELSELYIMPEDLFCNPAPNQSFENLYFNENQDLLIDNNVHINDGL